MHTSSGAINLISDSHASRYNFETLEGTLRSVPEAFSVQGEVGDFKSLEHVQYQKNNCAKDGL